MARSDDSAYRTYVLIAASICSLIVVGTFAINVVIDPLWYVGGSRLTRINYGFDERLSKSNLLHGSTGEFDCLIFGSSRVTLLDASSIVGHECFNFAVSNGQVDEFEGFGRWAASRLPEIRLVIVGVDGFNFSKHGIEPTVPDFITGMRSPPALVRTYASLDALTFSLRALTGVVGYQRVYVSPDFACQVAASAAPFDPPVSVDASDEFGGLPSSPTNRTGPFDVDRTDTYARLREIFPAAELVGYVPPLAVEYFEHVSLQGHLGGYLRSIHDASRVFDRFYDFAIPTPTTADPRNTYDGSHFHHSVNDRIGARISGSTASWGMDVGGLSGAEYRTRFRRALRRHREPAPGREGGPSPAARADRPPRRAGRSESSSLEVAGWASRMDRAIASPELPRRMALQVMGFRALMRGSGYPLFRIDASPGPGDSRRNPATRSRDRVR